MKRDNPRAAPSHYALRPADEPLIQAALRLGDWILAQSGVSRAQRKAVTKLQTALRALPRAPGGMIAEYGFHVRYESPDGKGLYRAWRVAISPAGLELYSVYSPDQKIELEEKLSHELNFWLRPERPSNQDGYYYEQWIQEVSNPDNFRDPAALFGFTAELEADTGD